jgi:hypothetical protein
MVSCDCFEQRVPGNTCFSHRPFDHIFAGEALTGRGMALLVEIRETPADGRMTTQSFGLIFLGWESKKRAFVSFQRNENALLSRAYDKTTSGIAEIYDANALK